MPSNCLLTTLYKGLFVLIIVFIILEYLFGTVTESKQWVAIFVNNSYRLSLRENTIEDLHSPVYKNIFGKRNLTKRTQPTERTGGFTISNLTFSTNSTIEASNNSFVIGQKNSSNDFCPEIAKSLLGKIEVRKSPVPTIQELESRFPWLKPGGHWQPDCKFEYKVAIVVPFRCRGEHLLLFLQHMHPFLKRQQLDYTIFIVEQNDNGPFNRAMLMNIGFKEALKLSNFDCFIFHDVDLLPEDDRNLYSCPVQPRHMSVAIDVFKYRLPYPTIFGGVSAITTKHFKQLNGFANSFWGWGGEDDDMSNRIKYHNLHISRYPVTIARYTMLNHAKDKPSPNRYEILKAGKTRYFTDGLSNLKYAIKELKFNKLYTWVLTDVQHVS